MHRLLTDTVELGKDVPALSREALRHLKVLRPKDGEAVELFDGHGRCRIYRYEAESATLRASETACRQAGARSPLTLFACVTKGSRWDWTIEKATELGVTQVVPVISARTIVRISKDERAAKRERWMRIAEDAARQSDAKWLPEICEPVDFADSLALVAHTRCFVGAIASPPPATIGEALTSLSRATDRDSGKPLAIYVGPEGDFTPDELAALLAIATPVSFGPTILRAETAAIYGVSILKAWSDAADAVAR